MGEPAQNMELKDPGLSKTEGIKQNNDQARPDETEQTAKTQQAAVKSAKTKQEGQTVSSGELASKALEEAKKNSFMEKAKMKIKKANPEFTDDKVETLAVAAFQRAMANKASGKGNEGNEEFVQPSSEKDGGM